MASFREAFRWLVPHWLSAGGESEDDPGNGGRVLYSLALLKDIVAEWMRVGHLAQYPTYAPNDALALIGEDRGILRGRSESRDAYVARLKAWRYPRGHRVRGNALALLTQIQAYWGGRVRVSTIDARGTRYSLDENGAWSKDSGAWDWDGTVFGALNWARFWLELRLQGSGSWGIPSISAWPTFGAGGWGATCAELEAARATVGHRGISVDDCIAMRRLLNRAPAWRPAGTAPQWAFVPATNNASSASSPGGTWGTYAGRYANGGLTYRFWPIGE